MSERVQFGRIGFDAMKRAQQQLPGSLQLAEGLWEDLKPEQRELWSRAGEIFASGLMEDRLREFFESEGNRTETELKLLAMLEAREDHIRRQNEALMQVETESEQRVLQLNQLRKDLRRLAKG